MDKTDSVILRALICPLNDFRYATPAKKKYNSNLKIKIRQEQHDSFKHVLR